MSEINEMKDKISKFNSTQLKSSITRCYNNIKKFEADCDQTQIPWYETWGHAEMEILFEFAPSLNDPKYLSKCREIVDQVYKKRKLKFIETLLKSKRTEEV